MPLHSANVARMKRHLAFAVMLLTLTGAVPMNDPIPNARIERTDATLDSLVDPAAKFTKLGEGYGWSEGPVWVEEGQ